MPRYPWQLLQIVVALMITEVGAQFRCYSCIWSVGDQETRGCADRYALIYDGMSDLFTSEAMCARCVKSEVYKDGELTSIFRSCMFTASDFDKSFRKDNACVEREVIDGTQISCVCEHDLCNDANGRHVYMHHQRAWCLMRYSLIGLITWYIVRHAFRH